MAQVLRMGSRGPDVVALQNGLNARLRPSPNLTPDGAYGPRTRAAVMQLQRDNWLVVDGEAGRCTQACALGTEGFTPILHNVPLIPQPTSSTCWAASTAMMTNSNVPAVIARTPPEMIGTSGGLKNWSATDQALPRGEAYGRVHGLRCHAPQSYMVSALVSMLQRGPLMWDMLWDAMGYLTPHATVPGAFVGSAGHMIVVIGIRGDGLPDGEGTTLRVNDPWSPNVGATYSVNHAKWMREVPTRTYRVFER